MVQVCFQKTLFGRSIGQIDGVHLVGFEHFRFLPPDDYEQGTQIPAHFVVGNVAAPVEVEHAECVPDLVFVVPAGKHDAPTDELTRVDFADFVMVERIEQGALILRGAFLGGDRFALYQEFEHFGERLAVQHPILHLAIERFHQGADTNAFQ